MVGGGPGRWCRRQCWLFFWSQQWVQPRMNAGRTLISSRSRKRPHTAHSSCTDVPVMCGVWSVDVLAGLACTDVQSEPVRQPQLLAVAACGLLCAWGSGQGGVSSTCRLAASVGRNTICHSCGRVNSQRVPAWHVYTRAPLRSRIAPDTRGCGAAVASLACYVYIWCCCHAVQWWCPWATTRQLPG